ncbi:MAG TPA: DUF92 domain-containing protein [Nitrososphaeraceae archaeon]|jgi:uncharacterized protein (TIGR00297 family)|nr:DUF92 domain-containing protein [Nitrososphaeraceae archaeon]
MLPLEQTVVWFSFMIATTIFAYRMRVIDRFGAIAAVPMGFVILYFGSVLWFFVLLIFFIIASIFTKYKYKQKQKMGLSEGNSGARGWKSVIANGGPAAAFAILYYLSHNNPVFTLSFTGSLSFALSDTIATEVGLLSKAKPRSILTGKEIDTGQSGGVTVRGEIAALTGSLLIGTVCWLLLSEGILLQIRVILPAAITAGMLATNIDSIFGATIQAKYRCTNCKKCLEKRAMHCNIFTIQESGISLIDNNVVNLLAAIIGAVISASFIIYY